MSSSVAHATSRDAATIPAVVGRSAPKVRRGPITPVPREPIAEAIEDAIAAYTDPHEEAGGGFRRTQFKGMRGLEIVIAEIARYTGCKPSTATRRVWRIRSGYDNDRRGRVAVTHVRFDVADEILCALFMQERWHTDPRLKEVYDRLGEEAT